MESSKRSVIVLGSTGSIGTQALEVIAQHADRFELIGIAAGGGQPELFIAQARQFGLQPHQVACANEQVAQQVGEALGGTVIGGSQAAEQLVRQAENPDIVLNALVGATGIHATCAALEIGAKLALANKESLVTGSQLVLDLAAPGQIVPVDSEHSAMAQCLRSGRREEVSRLVLTASGGPFRGKTRAEMMDVTPAQALAHPTWSMGQMNTLNSATLVNKGLELIEATLLFDMPAAAIDVVVHPQSIVHSMVTFVDGATIAQASPPSMKLPIAYALGLEERFTNVQPALDFLQASQWDFAPVDNDNFPAVQLAAFASDAGRSYPSVYNAVNEEAVARFVAGDIAFPQIVDTIAAVFDARPDFAEVTPTTIDDVLTVEQAARRQAHQVMDSWVR
ncbi:1-deoxy-D-xylulose-5-phosphate reductoisomerase [Corynebacterium choanae]|nr:1-deoxy-D-xylulose-5-phosphate reductoisomerase [Corynebacterium choanae]